MSDEGDWTIHPKTIHLFILRLVTTYCHGRVRVRVRVRVSIWARVWVRVMVGVRMK